jgi:hypothetical protein
MDSNLAIRFPLFLLACVLTVAAQGIAAQVTSAPTVTWPTVIILTNADDYLIQGTATADALVRIYADQNDNGVIDTGTDTVVASQQLSGGATAFGVAAPLAQDADNNFLATAEAAGDAESAPMDVLKIIEDSSLPATPVITYPTSSISTESRHYDILGTAEADSLVRIYVDSNNNDTHDAWENQAGEQQLIAGGTAFSVRAYVTCGQYRFIVSATDAAGNESAFAQVPKFDYTGACSGGYPGPECSAGEARSPLWLVCLFTCVALVLLRSHARQTPVKRV